ncbi:MAG: UDP-N-acetylmuramoyl-L-alanine--D-glutamate ligase [Clostridia bacterium]|nr:UDP-N-acetylmuramoyl-L-alanine--D-glutamate ligase [Clostridia bacterium]
MLHRVGGYSSVAIADMKYPEDYDLGDAEIFAGDGYLDVLDSFDIVIKSPGLVLPKKFSEYKCLITSQTELFFKRYRDQIIGITGTKGKSTVSSLTYHELSQNGIPALLAGNIGTPVFEIVDDITPETKIVLELSCHQLEYNHYSPALSVILNIYEDHLDHYGTHENYVNAKKNIYLHQKPLEMLYCGENFLPYKKENPSRTFVVKPDILPFKSLSDIEGVKLRGEHNLSDCAFAYLIAKSLGVTDEGFIAALKTFNPLKHRLEPVANIGGIEYFDDSISTTVESSINAMKSIENAQTILLGGMDRGIDYSALVEYLATDCKLANIVFMYASGKRIYEMLSERCGGTFSKNVYLTADLKEAVSVAKSITKPGGACILSPAAASYGYFKNFEERGDAFTKLVLDTNI